VRRAARILARAYDAALGESGLNITQLAVMRAVQRNPSQSLSRVAKDLAMDRTSLYRALTGLARQRWVRLSAGPDSRARSAAVTPAGEAALARADPPWTAMQRALMARFGAEQWRTLHTELLRLAECAQALAAKDEDE
jgi:DNA-binding MarR family transcriptional regulator